jgi:hypothetical protein
MEGSLYGGSTVITVTAIRILKLVKDDYSGKFGKFRKECKVKFLSFNKIKLISISGPNNFAIFKSNESLKIHENCQYL